MSSGGMAAIAPGYSIAGHQPCTSERAFIVRFRPPNCRAPRVAQPLAIGLVLARIIARSTNP